MYDCARAGVSGWLCVRHADEFLSSFLFNASALLAPCFSFAQPDAVFADRCWNFSIHVTRTHTHTQPYKTIPHHPIFTVSKMLRIKGGNLSPSTSPRLFLPRKLDKNAHTHTHTLGIQTARRFHFFPLSCSYKPRHQQSRCTRSGDHISLIHPSGGKIKEARKVFRQPYPWDFYPTSWRQRNVQCSLVGGLGFSFTPNSFQDVAVRFQPCNVQLYSFDVNKHVSYLGLFLSSFLSVIVTMTT